MSCSGKYVSFFFFFAGAGEGRFLDYGPFRSRQARLQPGGLLTEFQIYCLGKIKDIEDADLRTLLRLNDATLITQPQFEIYRNCASFPKSTLVFFDGT